MIYETGNMTHREMLIFSSLFQAIIGTEHEINQHDDNIFTITCFELENNEIEECRELFIKAKLATC